jgi:hypothetical protein
MQGFFNGTITFVGAMVGITIKKFVAINSRWRTTPLKIKPAAIAFLLRF